MDLNYWFVKDVMMLKEFLTVVKDDFAQLVHVVKPKNGVSIRRGFFQVNHRHVIFTIDEGLWDVFYFIENC